MEGPWLSWAKWENYISSLTDPTGNAISTARVDIKRDEKSIPAYPDAQGIVEISLPLGEWQLTAKDNGREALDRKIVISKNEVTNEKMTFGTQSGVHFTITKENGDPTPCKVQIIGIEGTNSPKLGPVDRAHGCNDQYHSENGKFSIGLAPGNTTSLSPEASNMIILKKAGDQKR